MATMKDIARLAGVSLSTVSHVVNRSRFVSPEITERVQNIITELNYKPSLVARSLKIKETNTFGMLVTASNNPFFSEVVRQVECYCERHHYHLIVVNTDNNSQSLKKHLDRLLAKQVDGLLLMCSEPQSVDMKIMANIHLPMVVIDWWQQPVNADIIHENSELGGYLATKALIDAGYTKIAVITGELSKSLSVNRLKGYKRAFIEKNLPICEDWIVESHFCYEGGVQATSKLLSLPNRPQAIFAMSDSIAIGAYHAIWQAKLAIPQDIAIIGYDNIELAQFLSPPLSTIHQPKARLAKNAVEQLLARINDPNKPFKTTQLTPELIVRQSF
ncbi:transcriptional repressor PurR [Vespertiliibacter pulmonis]|uniref:LacI family transcriptional regulator n=1 Tax=Vespertiliibacter pulmonis TaxID=1443036 RepID=A0A3N4WDT7_9PAST|nr:substrate-binding domain-containing protein [Vespertiliibacter pulmonis]QLB20773.1 transcriptional repressor PurR [Vespertiliibacter pulmonis]RPE83424.1 LacI family transcriptional regulator [Vespertiliibacter pulmonis]